MPVTDSFQCRVGYQFSIFIHDSYPKFGESNKILENRTISDGRLISLVNRGTTGAEK